jgi:hypothetical protein
MDIHELLQLRVENIDPAAPNVTERLVIDMAVADEDVVAIGLDDTHYAPALPCRHRAPAPRHDT